MSAFTRETPNYRIAATEHGDDIRRVAARELGDANRWAELVWLNVLEWPYITDDPARAGDGVLLTGAFIKIPAPTGVRARGDETGQVFERDCAMKNRMLGDDGAGDFAVVSGSKNLVQQLQHRIVTPRGQAMRHPTYGSLIYRTIGKVNGPAAGMLAAEYAKSAVQSDYRIKSMQSAVVSIEGDAVRFEGTAVTIAGGVVDIKTE